MHHRRFAWTKCSHRSTLFADQPPLKLLRALFCIVLVFVVWFGFLSLSRHFCFSLYFTFFSDLLKSVKHMWATYAKSIRKKQNTFIRALHISLSLCTICNHSMQMDAVNVCNWCSSCFLLFSFALRGFNIHTLMYVHKKHKEKGRQRTEIGKGIMTKIWLQLWLNRNRTLFRFRFCLYTWSSVWLLFAQQCISTQQSAYFCACFPHLFYFLYHFSISLYFAWALTCAVIP